MPIKRAATTAQPRNNRSRTSNGTRLIEGADGRTRDGRRYRDLIASFAADLGLPFAELSEGERTLVKQAAVVAMHVERLSAAMIRGEEVDGESLTRASNNAARLVAALRVKSKSRKPDPSNALRDYLAAKAAEAAA